MRDRSLFAVVLAFAAGVFLWPGAPRRAQQSVTNVASPALAQASGAVPEANVEGGRRPSVSRHGGAHPHVSGAMLVLLADYLALDPHPEARGHTEGSEHPEPSEHPEGSGHPRAGESATEAANAAAAQIATQIATHADSESDLSDAEADRLSHEIREAVKAGGLTIEPLIATLPDPIESHARWMFDRNLDGLSRGITASGYVMDRFGPESWWTSGNPHVAEAAGAAAAAGGVAASAAAYPVHHHEGEPGVILFHTTDGKRLLVLLIVTETATAGVHAHAMLTALDSAANLIALQQPHDDNAPHGAQTAATTKAGAKPEAAARPAASTAVHPDACCSLDADHTIKLVGPTFSGSAVSLRTAVDRWLSLRTDACWGLRIVSGSISSVLSRNTLGVWDKRVTFQATVPADDALQDALFTYLKTINGGHGERVAWIIEDNTTFGASLRPPDRSQRILDDPLKKAAHEPKSITRRAATAAPGAVPTPSSADAHSAVGAAIACRVNDSESPSDLRATTADDFQRIVIPFPMHVSRLHGAAEDERAQAQARAKTAFAPQNLVPLRLADSGSPRDAFPAMTPELTFASVEIALGSLLDIIHSEHIRLVAIMMTDTRDKLFLAEQLARRVPDALLFTLTTDILYLHSDVNDDVRGMLIASAYPLNPVTQPWTPHDRNRVLQMQHNSAQGIYNATIALLGSIGTDAPISNTVAPLLDYGAPGPIRNTNEEVTGPAIWISTVGRDTFWPLAIYDMRDSRSPHESFNDARLIKVRTSRVPRYPVPHLSLSPWACALLVALAVLALLHVAAYGLTSWRDRPARSSPTQPAPSPRRSPRHWLARSFRAPAESLTTDGAEADARANPGSDAAPSRQTAPAPIVWNDCNASHRRAPVTVYQLVCVAALWTFFTIPVTLSIIWLKAAVETRAIAVETPISAVVIGWSAAMFAMFAWIALTALAGALAWRVLRGSSRRWRTLRQETRGWPTTVRLLLWLIGVVAVVQSAIDILGHLPMTDEGLWAQLPYFMRVTTLGNGVSPVVTYFLLSTTFYAWGLVNLRRLATPTPMLCISPPESAKARDWRIPLLRGLGFSDPDGVIATFQCRSTDVFLAVPAAAPLAALASALVIYVIILGPGPLTIEGTAFGLAVALAMIVLHVITGLVVLQFYLLWRTLRGFLEQLSHDGLLDAFESLGKRHVRVISAGISLRGPRDIDVYLTEHSPTLVHAMVPETEKALGPATRTNTDKSETPTANVSSDLSWRSMPPAVLEFLTQRAAAVPDAQSDDLTVATLLAFAIQQILTRLGELLAFATVATLLVIAAFATFPFGRGPVLDGFGWLYVFILAGTALVVLIQVARDPILGRLKGYERPGAFNWDRELITKFALYAGVPLFGFISSQFPWLGRVLAQWLQPMQQALPWQ